MGNKITETYFDEEKIALSKNNLQKEDIKIFEKYIQMASEIFPDVKMQLMHGHFSHDDIIKTSDSEYVLMSNLFWSYRPEYYDSTFHIWAGLKAIRDLDLQAEAAIQYIKKWLNAYSSIDFIAKDPEFNKKFHIMLSERCLGALLVDILNQNYEENSNKHMKHLNKIFRDVFTYCESELE